MEASIKGFSIGAGLKGGIALFAILARLRSRGTKGASLRKAVAITNGEVVVSAANETLKYGNFLGAYAGTFVGVDELIAAIWGHKRPYTILSKGLIGVGHACYSEFLRDATLQWLQWAWWHVPGGPGACNQEEEQEDGDISVLPCTSNRELLHMYIGCWFSLQAFQIEAHGCGCVQLGHSYHHALLFPGEGGVQVQVLERS